MDNTANLHELVAQLHDLGNALDTAIDTVDNTDVTDGKYLGHSAKYWHRQFRTKDRHCARLATWKRDAIKKLAHHAEQNPHAMNIHTDSQN